MIYINQTQMKQLEVLLNQSTKGIHLLFDNDSLSEILQNPTEALEFFTVENLNKVQSLLGDFLQKQSLEDKIHFLRSLEKEDYERAAKLRDEINKLGGSTN